MTLHTTDSVCAITGSQPANLRRWYRSGLITRSDIQQGWNDVQLGEIQSMMQLTASGATQNEISQAHLEARAVNTAGWIGRKGDLIWQLEYGSDRALYRELRTLADSFSGDDFINSLMRPLSRWLHDDKRCGADRRLARFHQCVMKRASLNMRHSARNKATPLLLEALSVADETEIWLEAIRLGGQGFSVDISSDVLNTSSQARIGYEHHMLWCGAGISEASHQHYHDDKIAGKPVMLCGPDRSITKQAKRRLRSA
ncbi:transcriptional regulator [Duffyella gerundensis]|uniref:transcriptional regulator n=2 Tax=Duffyella gerundensis TaxID=1619313 RepID=UPI001654169E|nr:transcriptional regulator [Duffyella gerundensis]